MPASGDCENESELPAVSHGGGDQFMGFWTSSSVTVRYEALPSPHGFGTSEYCWESNIF